MEFSWNRPRLSEEPNDVLGDALEPAWATMKVTRQRWSGGFRNGSMGTLPIMLQWKTWPWMSSVSFLTKNEGYATCPNIFWLLPSFRHLRNQGFWQASVQLLSVHTPKRIDPDFQKTTKNQQRATSSDHAKPYHALSLQASYPGRRNMEPRLNARDR